MGEPIQQEGRLLFSILITTRNRASDLLQTLESLQDLIARPEVECIVCNDGSDDGTASVLARFDNVRIISHPQSKGYLACRNELLSQARGKYSISLDDDAQFLSPDPLLEIATFFDENPSCGAMAFRIYWGDELPESLQSGHNPNMVKSFVGCGHAWRMDAWREIPDYPEWFEFYGEEAVASMDLYNHGWEVWYVPQVLVWHRVNLKNRSKAMGDWAIRQRRSLRSGWYRYALFYPTRYLFRAWASSILAQGRKIVNGQGKLIFPIAGAIGDLLRQLPVLSRQRRSMNKIRYEQYSKLPEAEIYWKPTQG